VQRFSVIAQSLAETGHDPGHPVLRHGSVFGDSPNTVSAGLLATVAVTVPVRDNSRGTVSVPGVELGPAQMPHLVWKDARKEEKLGRPLEVWKGRKHPDVTDLGRSDALTEIAEACRHLQADILFCCHASTLSVARGSRSGPAVRPVLFHHSLAERRNESTPPVKAVDGQDIHNVSIEP
jgi:hypothetical protein